MWEGRKGEMTRDSQCVVDSCHPSGCDRKWKTSLLSISTYKFSSGLDKAMKPNDSVRDSLLPIPWLILKALVVILIMTFKIILSC